MRDFIIVVVAIVPCLCLDGKEGGDVGVVLVLGPCSVPVTLRAHLFAWPAALSL